MDPWCRNQRYFNGSIPRIVSPPYRLITKARHVFLVLSFSFFVFDLVSSLSVLSLFLVVTRSFNTSTDLATSASQQNPKYNEIPWKDNFLNISSFLKNVRISVKEHFCLHFQTTRSCLKCSSLGSGQFPFAQEPLPSQPSAIWQPAAIWPRWPGCPSDSLKENLKKNPGAMRGYMIYI